MYCSSGAFDLSLWHATKIFLEALHSQISLQMLTKMLACVAIEIPQWFAPVLLFITTLPFYCYALTHQQFDREVSQLFISTRDGNKPALVWH